MFCLRQSNVSHVPFAVTFQYHPYRICLHSYFSMKQKNETLKRSLVTRLNIALESTQKRLTIFEDQLKTFLEIQQKSTLLSSTEDLEDYFLTLPQLEISYTQDAISAIKIKEEENNNQASG